MSTTAPELVGNASIRERKDRYSREVTMTIDLLPGSVPDITGKHKSPSKYSFSPTIVRLVYRSNRADGSGLRAGATVYGRPSNGSLINSWADIQGDPEGWPEWLRELADQLHPDRPGGWPGEDPTGSYL